MGHQSGQFGNALHPVDGRNGSGITVHRRERFLRALNVTSTGPHSIRELAAPVTYRPEAYPVRPPNVYVFVA